MSTDVYLNGDSSLTVSALFTKELSEIGATIASYLSVKEAISTMLVCKSGLFSKGLSDEECQGNTNKYRKIND